MRECPTVKIVVPNAPPVVSVPVPVPPVIKLAGGVRGPAGPAGEQGPQGASGPVGADGAEGPAGAPGPQGDPGPPGDRGPAGADGKDGADGAGVPPATATTVPQALTIPATTPVEDARNLCPNPTAVADGALLGTPGAAAQFQAQGVTIPATANGTTTAAEMTNAYSAATWIASRAAVDGLVGDTTPRTVTMLVRNPNPVDIRASLRTSSQANIWTTIPAGEARTISRAVDDSILLYAQRVDGPAEVGDKVQWTDITTTEDFFTGDTPPTSTHQYAWAGAPNNSASIRYTIDTAVQWAPTLPPPPPTGTHTLTSVDGVMAWVEA